MKRENLVVIILAALAVLLALQLLHGPRVYAEIPYPDCDQNEWWEGANCYVGCDPRVWGSPPPNCYLCCCYDYQLEEWQCYWCCE